MRRREFFCALGGAVAAFPRAVLAQSSTATAHRIGILAQDLQPGLLETLRDELRRLGYIEGRSIVIELRNAAGQNERLPPLAEELLLLNVKVIVAVNTPAALAAKRATNTVPVVMMRVADPEKSGLVAGLARPGGNITGLSFMPDALGPKGVELLREILPQTTRMAAFYQGNNLGAVFDHRRDRAESRTIGFEGCSSSGGRRDPIRRSVRNCVPRQGGGALRHGRWSDYKAQGSDT